MYKSGDTGLSSPFSSEVSEWSGGAGRQVEIIFGQWAGDANGLWNARTCALGGEGALSLLLYFNHHFARPLKQQANLQPVIELWVAWKCETERKFSEKKKIISFISVWIVQCLTRTWIPSRQLPVNSQADEHGWKKPERLRKQYNLDSLLNRIRTRSIVVRTEGQQQANLRLLIKQSAVLGKMK